MLAFILLVLGILSRLVAHAPNFTPVVAIALFGGVYLKKSQALYLPVLLLMLSDFVIGLHQTIAFTWGSVFLIAAAGVWLKQHKTVAGVTALSAAGALFFFLVTNFGAWLVFYPHTLAGLKTCYWLALPFFRNTLLSTLAFSAVMFGAYEGLARLGRRRAVAAGAD